MIQKYVGHRPDVGLLILRVAVGAIFLAHGIQKFQAGAETVAGFFGSIGIPMTLASAWIVTLVETLGGAALILGIGTRCAATLLAIVMLVAIATVKMKMGLIGGYELDLALLAAAGTLLLSGGGKYSLEEYLKKKTTP